MSDTPTDRTPTPTELCMGFVKLAQDQGCEGAFAMVCNPTKPDGTFERVAYVDCDASKLLTSLCIVLRAQLPEYAIVQFVEMLLRKDDSAQHPQPQEPTNPNWVN